MVLPEQSFNQIPAECQGRCELTQGDVNKHGIVLTRRCPGPSYEGPDPTESVRVRDGQVVDIESGTVTTVGRVACTNPGFSDWLQARKRTFETGI